MKVKYAIWKPSLGVLLTIGLIVRRFSIINNRDDYIIQQGIKAYENSVQTSTALIGVGVAITIFLAVLEFFSYRKRVKKEMEIQQSVAEREQTLQQQAKQETSYLASDGVLNEEKLRKELKTKASQYSPIANTYLKPLWEQSVKMDEMQEKLSVLLAKNGADRLDDAEEMLVKAEQQMLQNLRKVLNYMEVCDSETTDGINKVKDSAIQCKAENQAIMQSSSDFLMAMTEYLNNQGNSENALESLNNYKNVLNNTLHNNNTQETTTVKETQLVF